MTFITKKFFILTLVMSGLAVSCHSGYMITDIRGDRTEISSYFDSDIDSNMQKFINYRKSDLENEMSPVIGYLSAPLPNENRNFNPLANVIADIMKDEAEKISGKDIDLAVINIGGLRCDLPQGEITIGKAYELLPFMNTLCIMEMKGSDIEELFRQIAKVGGEGISNGTILTISEDGKLIDGKINGKEIEASKIYHVATIDYLAEGNDGMEAFKKGTNVYYPDDAVLRDIFIRHIKDMTASGQVIGPNNEIRIIVK